MTVYSSETPEGRKVVWTGQRPVEEGLPVRLPGVVVRELPDGWNFVAWVDKDSWQSPEAVYESKWLEEVSDEEFERLVSDLRTSDWAGLPPRAPFSEPAEQPTYEPGAKVRWVGPVEGDYAWQAPDWRDWYPKALGGVLTPSHPGTVIAVDRKGDPFVSWIDKTGEFAGRASVPKTFVVAMEDAEAARRTDSLRASDWSGLDHGSLLGQPADADRSPNGPDEPTGAS